MIFCICQLGKLKHAWSFPDFFRYILFTSVIEHKTLLQSDACTLLILEIVELWSSYQYRNNVKDRFRKYLKVIIFPLWVSSCWSFYFAIFTVFYTRFPSMSSKEEFLLNCQYLECYNTSLENIWNHFPSSTCACIWYKCCVEIIWIFIFSVI